MDSTPNPWTQSPTHKGLISLGTHSLFLTTAGPPHTPGQPVVIIEAGHSDCSNAWAAVIRAVSPFARIYSYDRSGYGQSGIAPSPRTAVNIATDLSALLNAVGVQGPFIIVGHSYGGILIREFFELRKEDVIGLVLVDTVQEDDIGYSWPFAEMEVMWGGLDTKAIRGLDKSHKFTQEEWDLWMKGETQEGVDEAAKREFEEIHSSAKGLAEKKQFDGCVLQNRPVSVIKGESALDQKLLFEAGVKAGNGTAEQRETMKKWVDGIDEIWERNQKKQLMLSKKGRIVYARQSGHQVHFQQPELVAEEIKWVLDSYVP